jgi:hypothetical protein
VRLLFTSVVVLVVFTICGVVRSRQRGAHPTVAVIPKAAALSCLLPGAQGAGARGSLGPAPSVAPESSTAPCAAGRMRPSVDRRPIGRARAVQ